MPAKKRVKKDVNVVYTESDNKRASGAVDENDFDDDTATEKAMAKFLSPGSWISLADALHLRRNAVQVAVQPESEFPFLELPPEIRNMIYKYLVLSKSPASIALGGYHHYHQGGIQCAILRVNWQVYQEAVPMLYEQNNFVAAYSPWADGVTLRQDNKNTSQITQRSLRSGRSVDMTVYRGFIYRDIATRLNKVDISITLFKKGTMCDEHTLWHAFLLNRKLATNLASILTGRCTISGATKSPWKIRILQEYGTHAQASLCSRMLREILLPLLSVSVLCAVRDGKVQLSLEGKFPAGTSNLFRAFHNFENFDMSKLETLSIENVSELQNIRYSWIRDVFRSPLWGDFDEGKTSSILDFMELMWASFEDAGEMIF